MIDKRKTPSSIPIDAILGTIATLLGDNCGLNCAKAGGRREFTASKRGLIDSRNIRINIFTSSLQAVGLKVRFA